MPLFHLVHVLRGTGERKKLKSQQDKTSRIKMNGKMKAMVMAFCVVMFGISSGCSQYGVVDEDNLLVGKWKCISSISKYYFDPTQPTVGYDDEVDYIYEFSKNGKVTVSNSDGHVDVCCDYYVNESTISWSEGGEVVATYVIEDLTKRNLTLHRVVLNEDDDDSIFFEVTATFKRM